MSSIGQYINILRFRVPSQSTLVRIGKFMVSGILSFFVQLSVLEAIVTFGVPEDIANIIAIASGTQANFILSSYITWSDRGTVPFTAKLLRWLQFTTVLSITNTINEVIFIEARHTFPLLIATTMGSLIVAILNFLCGDRFIFRNTRTSTTTHSNN